MSSTTTQIQSTFVSSSTPTKYDVFLSFHGEDTRLNFTGHLYDKLDSNSIVTFKDDPEIRGGEVISDALLDGIRNSKTYIVILSKNYASSSWCLDELVEIFNCHITAERLVIPVFYKIDPCVVRHQIGSFKGAFKKHRVRVGMEKVNKWKFTLKQVASFSGFHVRENTSEADIINEIVDEILPIINPKVLDVAKYPVGLDSRVKVIAALLNGGTEEGVTKIGLYGMGGVGKTTLAKAVFNQLLRSRSFKGSCFLANVREASRTFKGTESLQKKFINDVLKTKKRIEVDNVEEGIMLIKMRMCSAKVLVLIDDVDDPRQYESLVASFASGSVVITTTRDQEILDKIEVEPKFQYRVNELDDDESLALFTRHVFRNAEPNNTLMVFSTDILRHADGLPLALEVFGSYLYNQSEVGWKSYIEKLQRVPNKSIHQKLVISLDDIESDDPMLKNIFLDIACFFIGWEKKEVVEIMETYYYCADHKIAILQKRSLVKIKYNGNWGTHILDMHDLLRDMGREIARNNSSGEPGGQSRLWESHDIDYVLTKHKGTEAIEGIFYYLNYQVENLFSITNLWRTISAETFRRMSKLRFLYLQHVNLTGSFDQTFEGLRWLCWEYCPLKCLPSEFYPRKLVILELANSEIRTMWELNMVPGVFEKLKTLNMSYSKDLTTTPDFTNLPCLETLNLQACSSLEEIHVSIGSLVRLVSLNLYCCVKLRSLPDTICNLRVLQVLAIRQCDSLEALPIQLGNIESLTRLDAEGLTVSKLPDSIGHLRKLIMLDISNNRHLQILPDTICNLQSLEILDIDSCSSLEAFPTEIGNIESLKEIYVMELTVSKLPDSIGHLSKIAILNLSNNKKLETLPDTICNLRSLEILRIDGCEKLERLPDQLWKITRLRELNASGATMLKKLPDIGSRQLALSLQELKLSGSGITALPSGFTQLSNLQSIQLDYCDHLLSIPKLPSSLKRIIACGSKSLDRCNLSKLRQLETLNLLDCDALTEIQGLEELTALREFHLEELASRLHLTKRLFQLYSESEHQITITVYAPEWKRPQYWPYWMIEPPYWTSESRNLGSTTLFAHLLPHDSHNFMGVILCFSDPGDYSDTFNYSVKNTTSGFIWSDCLAVPVPSKSGSLMVIVPKSIFSVRDEDYRIELEADNVRFLGIHLLYNTETKRMTDYVVKKHENSVDALRFVDPVLQNIFLDIACFFIGWDKDVVVPILETFYSNVDLAVLVLRRRHLLTISDSNKLEMSDLLWHIGKKIARNNNSPDEPEKHSRLWLSIDIYKVLKKDKGTEVIEGIVPGLICNKNGLEGESFTLEAFKKMTKVRFLYLKKVHLTGSFEQTFEDLRWLCWEYCPLKFLPFEFYPPKLVFLELPRSNIITMWELNTVPHVFEKLKTLDMLDSQDLITTPDFITFPFLETLNLRGCESLEEVHMSIGRLARLVSLDLHGCIKLSSLPDTICNLRALEELDISGCSCLEALPTALGNIQSLKELDAGDLNVLKLPDSIGHLSKLVKLRLSNNKNLETLPDTICNLRSLETLYISGCEKLKTFPDLPTVQTIL